METKKGINKETCMLFLAKKFQFLWDFKLNNLKELICRKTQINKMHRLKVRKLKKNLVCLGMHGEKTVSLFLLFVVPFFPVFFLDCGPFRDEKKYFGIFN